MKILRLLPLLLFVLSCSNDSTEKPIGESTELRYFENSALVIPEENTDFFVVNIGSGDKLVFEYEFVIESDPNIADSGYSETLLFEVDPELNSFSFSENELLEANTYFRQLCFCANVESIAIDSGTISGARTGANTWEIDININVFFVEFSEPRVVEVSGEFTLHR